LYDNFYRQLPIDFNEFKTQVHENFPLIIDTKLIAQTSSIIQSSVKNTVLSDMARIFQLDPFLEPKIVFGREFDYYNSKEESCHEAGYDAYITGLSLLRMYTEIVKPEKGVAIDLASEICHPNKIFMMRSLMTYMNLNGDDGMISLYLNRIIDKPDTSNVFLMNKFPVNWRAGDIQQSLKELGHINLKWLDDQSCLVIVRDSKKVSIAHELANRTYKKSSTFMLKAFIDTSSSLIEPQNFEQTKKRQRVEASEEIAVPATKKNHLESYQKISKKNCTIM
jgi:poly(A)-specific ribonuclease